MKNINKTIVLAASPGSASNTLRERLEKTLKCKHITLKSGASLGHLFLKVRKRTQFLKYFNLSFFEKKERLIYGHIFPTKYNLDILNNYFDISTFIVTYRNIYEQLNYFYKWKFHYNKTPLSFPESNYFKLNNFQDDFDIDLSLLLLLNFYKYWFWNIQNNRISNYKLVSYEDIISDNIRLNLELEGSNIKSNKFKYKKFDPIIRHIQIIDKFINEHKEIDFSLIT